MGWIRFHPSTIKVRPIQVIADIYGVTGGKSIVSTKYDFVGNVLQTREKHENDIVVSTNTYDTRGRLLTTSTSLNGSTPATMAYVYDELGRLTTKKYGNNTESETYAYNVRGWLTEKSSSKFNMKLRYQNPTISGTQVHYNGNITEWEWKQGANAAQAYTFTYDGISRLTDNKQYSQSGSNWTLNNSFVEQGLTYDQNGNIKSLQRNANGSLKDNFSYNYTGNQLTSLNSVSGNYLYDKNGNMIKDPRKNLDIEYNSLNLLSEVKQGSTSKAKYIYASDRTKLGVVDADGNGYDYRGSLIYKRTANVLSLESAAFSDGRIIKSTSSYTPNYNITDHLGSVRVVFDGSGNLVETNDYYAFGGRHADGSSTISNNRFKFNGKEEQTTGNLGFLDYGSRMNDPELGRWFVQDPMAENHFESSSYTYCANNPVLYVDPNGEDYYLNLYTGRVSYFEGSSDRFDMGMLYLAGNDAKFGEIGNAISKLGFKYIIDHNELGGFVVETDAAYKAFMMMKIFGVDNISAILGLGVSGSTQVLNAIKRIGVDKVGKIIASKVTKDTGEGISKKAIEDGIDYMLKDNKMIHLFKDKHNFNSIIDKLGGKENFVKEVMNGISKDLPKEGQFVSEITLCGQKVVVRGAVHEGIPKVGTMYSPIK